MIAGIAYLLDILCTMCEAFCLYRLYDLLLERRFFREKTFRNEVLIFVLVVITYVPVVVFFNSLQLTSFYTPIAMVVESLILTMILWRGNPMDATAVVTGYLCVNVMVGVVEMFLIGQVGREWLIQAVAMERDIYRVVFLIVSGSIWFAINEVIYRFLKKCEIRKQSMTYFFWIAFIGFWGSIFLLAQMLESFDFDRGTAWGTLFFVILMALYVFYLFTKRRELQFQVELLNSQNSMLRDNYEQNARFYEENAKLYHDMKHHLNTVYYMLEQEATEEAKQYIENLQRPLSEPTVPTRTGIDVVDVVLHESERKASEKGIQINIHVPVLPQDIGIEKTHLCALIANLMDNAIEAAKSEISICVTYVHRMIFLQVKNDYLTAPQMTGRRLITGKADKERHGWGLRIVEQIANIYEGSMTFRTEDGCFIVEIMLNEKADEGQNLTVGGQVASSSYCKDRILLKDDKT